MNRDEMIRSDRANASSWRVLIGLYVMLLGAMVLSASVIL